MADFRQSPEWGEHLKTRGWLVDQVKSADGKHKLQVLIFRIGWWPWKMMKLQRNVWDPDFSDLMRLKKKHRVIQTVIEPMEIQDIEKYIDAGFRKAKAPFLALSTVIIDLTKSKQSLWEELSENARRLIKKNENLKVVSVEAEEFHKLWKEFTKVWIMTLPELKSLLKVFGDKVHLSVASDEKGYHSGLIVVETENTADYYQTWTSNLGRKSGAHYKLVWEEILKAKKKGLKLFDFEGIYDPEYPIQKWKGFSEFKKKFGGKVIKHPGSFTRWF